MERKNKSLNVYFACVIILFVEQSLFHFPVLNTEKLKYYKDLFIPAELSTDDMDRLLISLRNLSLVSRCGADLVTVFTLALLKGEMSMMALAVLNWCPAHTMCQAKETHRLVTLNISDVLKRQNKDLLPWDTDRH